MYGRKINNFYYAYAKYTLFKGRGKATTALETNARGIRFIYSLRVIWNAETNTQVRVLVRSCINFESKTFFLLGTKYDPRGVTI